MTQEDCLAGVVLRARAAMASRETRVLGGEIPWTDGPSRSSAAARTVTVSGSPEGRHGPGRQHHGD